MAHLVEKSRIAESGDYNLSGDRYRVSTNIANSDFEMVELGEVCEINPKKSKLKDLAANLEVSFVPMADIKEKEMYFEIQETTKL